MKPSFEKTLAITIFAMVLVCTAAWLILKLPRGIQHMSENRQSLTPNRSLNTEDVETHATVFTDSDHVGLDLSISNDSNEDDSSINFNTSTPHENKKTEPPQPHKYLADSVTPSETDQAKNEISSNTIEDENPNAHNVDSNAAQSIRKRGDLSIPSNHFVPDVYIRLDNRKLLANNSSNIDSISRNTLQTTEATPSQPVPLVKPIYDATLTDPRPHWDSHIVPRMSLIYPFQLGINTAKHQLPSDAFLRYQVQNLPDAEIYCLDIEHLLVCIPDAEESARNTLELLRLVAVFREIKPQAKIGYWGLFPRGNYVAGRGENKQRQQARKNNKRAVILAESVDIIFPSFYRVTMNDGMEPTDDDWRNRVDFIASEARTYGKPVYGFIRPLLESEGQQNWPLQLQHAYKVSDALVIWSHPFKWSTSDLWWQQTIDFMDHIKNAEFASYD